LDLQPYLKQIKYVTEIGDRAWSPLDILNLEQGQVLSTDAEVLKALEHYFEKNSPYAKELRRLFLDFSR
jgi:flagellar motor switch protein FliM